MKRGLLVGTLLLLSVAHLGAQQPPLPNEKGGPDVSVLGLGRASCGRWVEARRNNDETGVNYIQSWVQGFLTASNLWLTFAAAKPGSANAPSALRTIDAAAMQTWLDQQCAANPTRSMVEAATALVAHLRR